MARKKAGTVNLTLRIDEDLHFFLKRHAKERGVSLNAEICRRVGESLHVAMMAHDILAAARKMIEDEAVGHKMESPPNYYSPMPGLTTTTGGRYGTSQARNEAQGTRGTC